jgi:hypothetical protein
LVNWTLAEPQPLAPVPWDQRCPVLPFTCFSDTPAYIYNLPFLYENGIPEDLHEKVTRRELVEVPTRFHSDHPDALILQWWETGVPFSNAGTALNVRIWFRPGAVTEYFLADDRISWFRFTDIQRETIEGTRQIIRLLSDDWFPAVEAGHRRDEERWHEAPARMGAWDLRDETINWHRQTEPRPAAAARSGHDGNQFVVPFLYMGNSRGHGSDIRTAGSWRMWNLETGAELPRSGIVFPLAPESARYRLEQVEDYSSTPLVTGPATTTWEFTSRPSDEPVPQRYRCPIQEAPREDICQIQPLILLEYQLGLDINNRAPAGRAHEFTVVAGHHSRAIDRSAVSELTVEASFDDGATWVDARVVSGPTDTVETGGLLPATAARQAFRVVLAIPPLQQTNGFVSLRVQAVDANGGTVEQTIARAYILKP